MKYKFSNYNYFVKYENEYILFNTLTLALLTIDEKNKKLMDENNIDEFLSNFTQEEINALIDNGILLDECINELKIIKDNYWYNKYKDDTLHVSVLTTLACNFGCPYCFETRRNVQLTEDIENAIIDFVKRQSLDNKFIHIDWYGGEPLLNLKSIERISKELMEFAEEKGVVYYSSITTNGYLLDDETLNTLIKYNLKSAQITLDGPKYIHDKMRPLQNKMGTFDTIIKNIKNASKKININLRVNINEDTYKHVDELLENLVGIDNLTIAIKAIVSASYKDYNAKVVTAEDYARIVVEKYLYAKKLGLNTAMDKLFHGSVHRYCIVDSDSQFIISPTGRLFKCGESYLDDEPGIIGSINNDGIIEIDDRKKTFWDKDPFEFEECKNCKVLPLCLGGCQMKRLIKKIESCSPEYKYALDELIKHYYSKVVAGEID